MGEHAMLAPSAAHRWMKCPGSVSLCSGIPNEDSVHAAEGTFAHGVAASCLILEHKPHELIGDKSACGRFEVDQALADHVQLYIDAVRSVLLFEDAHLQIEQRVEVTPECWGTADALAWTHDTLHVFDLKYGSGVFVPAEDNFQALIYALGAVLSFPKRAESIEKIELHIVQPRHYGSKRKWRTHPLKRRGLHTWHAALKAKIDAVLRDDADLLAGEDQCRFCPAKAICPELRRLVSSTAKEVFQTPARLPPDPQQLSVDELARVLTALPLLEQWVHAVRQHAYDLAERKRIKLPGFKLVQKVGHRKWKDEKKSATVLRKVGVKELYTKKLISPAEAERRLGKARKKLVDDLAFKPSIGTALVPEDDRRPAVSPGDAFSELPNADKESNSGRTK